MKKINIFFVLILSLLCVSSSNASAPAEWHMVHCNSTSRQGDCHYLTDNGINIIVDAGQRPDAVKSLIPYLRRLGVKRIHHAIVSHPHTDHYGGFDAISDARIKIDNVYFNKPPKGVSDFDFKPHEFNALLEKLKSRGSKLHDISAGFHLKLPTTEINVIEAKKVVQRGGVNDYSIIMAWDAGGYRSLFTGDLNKYLGKQIAKDKRIKADILKIPHHGVTGIAPNEFFDNVGAKIMMLPAPKHLWFNPRGAQVKHWFAKNKLQKQREAFEAVNKVNKSIVPLICRNGFNGTVRLKFYAKRVLINSDNPTTDCPNGNVYLPVTDKMNLRKVKIDMGAIYSLLLDD